MIEQDFGKYQLLKKLATGGMAEVWLARQHGIEGFERLLVVKRILPHLADDPEFVQMFLNEAKIAARFNHANIAQIYDLGEANGTYFIAMEYVHGEDLGRLMRKAWSSGQWIARPLSIRIVAAACEGLAYAHSKTDDTGKPLKVVHRDISPQNILISFDGSVKVVDFGIAKAADQASMTKSGAIKGKFAYMSPEQAAGKVLDHRSDIFAIGLVLYELLTGVRPLKRDSELATLQAALECNIEPPSAVADVPSEVDGVVMGALAKAADDRYRDARAFQMALEEFLVGQRWVAGSVQISELMTTLFSDRLEEEKRLGRPNPDSSDLGSVSGNPAPPAPPSERGGAAGQPQQSASDMEWEAPPGENQGRERGSHPSGRGLAKSYRRDSGSQPVTDPATGRSSPSGPRSRSSPSVPVPDVPDWDAPPSNEIPGRRRDEPRSNPHSTAIARTNSRPEISRGGREPSGRSASRLPAVDTSDEDDSLPPISSSTSVPRTSSRGGLATPAKRRISSGQVKPPPDLEQQRHTLDTDEPADTLPPPRRRSSGLATAAKRRTASGSEMPEAPPPTRAPGQDKPFAFSNSAVNRMVDVEGLKERSRRRLKAVLVASIAVAVVVMGLIFRTQIWDALTHSAADGQGIYLTVNSNPRARVFVRHAPDEGAKDPESDLGETPLNAARGAHLRDTLILSNPEIGLYYEEEIKFGEPNKVQKIEKEFSKGSLKLVVLPKGTVGLSFWRGAQEVGRYPGPKIELFEGTQKLEVRGNAVKRPFAFEVEIKPNATVERTVDLTGSL